MRFRVSTLLLLVAGVASVVGHVITIKKQRSLEEENRDLRRETGRPVIRDPRRVAVGVLQFPAQSAYRFRVYRPTGRNIVLKFAFDSADHKKAQNAEVMELSKLTGPELTIDISLETHVPEQNDIGVQLLITDGHGSMGRGSGASFGHWPSTSHADGIFFHVDGFPEDVADADPDLPRILLRLTGGTTTEFKSGKDRTAMLVWLEEEIDDGWKPSPWRLSD